jgi:hypothetical protein
MAAPSVATPQRISRLRRVIGFLVGLLVIYVVVCGYFYFWQDQIGYPVRTEYEKVTPLNVGFNFEDLHIPVSGSEQIHAWRLPTPSGKVLLLFHGSDNVLEDNITGALYRYCSATAMSCPWDLH